jgi:hypothetical protein
MLELGELSRGELSKAIKLCEAAAGCFYLGIEVDAQAAILNTAPD